MSVPLMTQPPGLSPQRALSAPAKLRRIERGLWVVAFLALLLLLGLGLPEIVAWEWITRIAVALVGIVALVARACVQLARRRVEQLSARVMELESRASDAPTPSAPRPPDVLASVRGIVADIERRIRDAQEASRAPTEAADQHAARHEDVAALLREALRATQATAPEERQGDGAEPTVDDAFASLSERIASSGEQHAALVKGAGELVGQIKLLAASQASLAARLAALEEISDRADALALRGAREDLGAGMPAGEWASELAGIAQELAAATARARTDLGACREATSLSVMAARERASEAERSAGAGRELATALGILEAIARVAVSATARERSIASAHAATIRAAADRLRPGDRPGRSVGDGRHVRDELEDLARDVARLQTLIARSVGSGAA